jgi:predicted ABC-type ATPase
MSGLSLLSTKKNSAAYSPGYAPTGLAEGVGASFRNTVDNYNADAEYDLKTQQRRERDAAFEQKAGVKVRRVNQATETTNRDLDLKYGVVQEDQLFGGKYVNLPDYSEIYARPDLDVVEDQFFTAQKNTLPDLSDIRLNADINQAAIDQARASQDNAETILARNPSDTSRLAASLIGGLSGSLTDKLTLATLPIGAGPTRVVGTGGFAVAKAIAAQAAKEGAIQAAITAAATPQIASWQKEVGHVYGLSEALTDIGFGFAGGAVVRGGIEAAVPTVRAVRRGAANVSSYMLDQIATRAPQLSQTVKDSLKYMSRSAYIDEAAPVPMTKIEDVQNHRQAFEKTFNDIDNYAKPSPEIKGAAKIVTPRNELELDVIARVMELDDLITSNKAGFDQSLQPRDRSNRIASDARIQEIAARLDPAQLGESRVSNTGAPIIGQDMMVESGNGRVMALEKVYELFPDNAKKYRDFLESQGHKTKGFKRPVLVRQRVSELTPDQRREFVVYSNEDVADRLSTTERAMADARLLSDNTMTQFRGGNIESADNSLFVRDFIDTVVSPAERNSFITPDGRLSQDGVRRLRGAMLARAYGNSDLVQRLLEDTDTNIKTIGNVLMDLAGDWSKMRSMAAANVIPKNMDITRDLMDAVRTVMEARNAGRPITDYTSQRGLFAESELTAESTAILRGLYNVEMTRALGEKQVREFLSFYVREAEKTQGGTDLLGSKPLDPMDILITSLQRTHTKEAVKEMQFDMAGSLELAAIREAGLLGAMKGLKHPRTGQSFMEALEDFSNRPETIKTKDVNSPEWKAQADGIVDNLINDQGGNFTAGKTMEIVLGPPGAGKSSVLVKRLQKDLKAIIIDSDMVKEKIPEFADGIGANAVYEESKLISTDWLAKSVANEWNIIHPIVGASPKKVNDLVDEMLSLGYSINIRLVHIPSNVSLERVINRFGSEGRLVPPSYVMSIGDGPIKTFDMMKQKEGINAYSYFDNNVKFGQEPRIVESNDPRFISSQEARPGIQRTGEEGAGNQKQEPVEPQRLDEFFDLNAHRLREYRQQQVTPPTEVKPSDRMAATEASFNDIVKQNPDMMITLDDGTVMRLADYANGMKADQNLLEALTTCRLA